MIQDACRKVACAASPLCLGAVAVQASLVEVEAAGCSDDASERSNGSEDSDQHAQDENDPGRPEVPASHARALDHQVDQRGAARAGAQIDHR